MESKDLIPKPRVTIEIRASIDGIATLQVTFAELTRVENPAIPIHLKTLQTFEAADSRTFGVLFAGNDSLLHLMFSSAEERAVQLRELLQGRSILLWLPDNLRWASLLRNWKWRPNSQLKWTLATQKGVALLDENSESAWFVLLAQNHDSFPAYIAYDSVRHIGCVRERIFVVVHEGGQQLVYSIQCVNSAAAHSIGSSLKKRVFRCVTTRWEVLWFDKWRLGENGITIVGGRDRDADQVKFCREAWEELVQRLRKKYANREAELIQAIGNILAHP